MLLRVLLAMLILCVGCAALAQQGHIGEGHEMWHEEFYSSLRRMDNFPCCSGTDCRPTQQRTAGDHYEVLVDGEWVIVESNKIVKRAAPDGGAHVCAPLHGGKGQLYCVVLRPEV